MKLVLAAIVAFLLLLPAAAPAATDPAGLWQGTLKTPNGDLDFVFYTSRC